MDRRSGLEADHNTIGWRFDNTYSRLPDVLFAPAKPATVRAPRVSILNHRLADELGLDLGAMSPEAAAALFAGQDLPDGSRPIAQAYAGHQFGGFTMLGDGRAILLGEHRTPSGRLVDIQLKGAGRTRFSRGGDGRAALGPMLREYVISEAMAALGIPTTRSLAVVTTGEPVYRASALQGAILTRVAASHIRVGTFEYLAARQDEAEPAGAGRLRDRPPLPGTGRRPAKVPGVLPRGHGPPGLAHRPVATRRVHPRGDEHRQHGDLRGDDRLRPVCVHERLPTRTRCSVRSTTPAATPTATNPRSRSGTWPASPRPCCRSWIPTRRRRSPSPRRSSANIPPCSSGTGSPGCGQKLGLQTDEAGDVELIRSLLDWMQKSRADFTNTFRDLSSEELPAGDRYRDPDFRAWYARWQLRLSRDGRPSTVGLRRDAGRQPGRHPAEPPGGGSTLRRGGPRRPVGAAPTAGGVGDRRMK